MSGLTPLDGIPSRFIHVCSMSLDFFPLLRLNYIPLCVTSHLVYLSPTGGHALLPPLPPCLFFSTFLCSGLPWGEVTPQSLTLLLAPSHTWPMPVMLWSLGLLRGPQTHPVPSSCSCLVSVWNALSPQPSGRSR